MTTLWPENLRIAAAGLLEACIGRKLKLATAESCTGGLVVACLTEIAGSSAVVDRGFVTYSNEAKIAMLGIDAALLGRFGAVSAEVALAMAQGALARSDADCAVAITGIAGPGGATAGKPVGLVHLATARRGGALAQERHVYSGDRAAVRMAAVETALAMLRRSVEELR
ncbi:MAG: CinA family protein [Geminicoccaceae bacterium]|nr:CinA family protein [Geminicoccaceae bacterium]